MASSSNWGLKAYKPAREQNCYENFRIARHNTVRRAMCTVRYRVDTYDQFLEIFILLSASYS